MEVKKMSRGMEWIIGGVLALIIAIVGFYYTKKFTAFIIPLVFVFYGIYSHCLICYGLTYIKTS